MASSSYSPFRAVVHQGLGAMTAALRFAQLAVLAPSLGVADVPCPLCSVLHNPGRRVLRIWREREDFIGFACARCGEKGWAGSADKAAAAPSPERLADPTRNGRATGRGDEGEPAQ